MSTNYNTYTLKNGLRVIHRQADSDIVYCGYQVAAGTRNEAPGEEGLAHFCEHVSFKGTERRTALQIINALESVGGELNAFTNKESTVYYAALLKEHFAKAVDLLSDIMFHSTYPQAEIDKEVEVICDEIESYNDSPSELIYDDFEDLIFRGHPLGHNILGTAENVRRFKTEDAKRFTGKFYTPENMIFFCYGDVSFKKLIKRLERTTPPTLPQGEEMENTTAPQPPKGEGNGETQETNVPTFTPPSGAGGLEAAPGEVGGLVLLNRSTHQAHVMIGCRAYDVYDDKRMTLYLLNNILGGPGMNARLNLALRERCGLVYTVESSMVSYGDTGLWTTYFGCDQKDVKRCCRLVRRELDKVMEKPLTESQLRGAKRQIKGQIALACENHENFAIDFGKSFLHYGWEKDITSLYEKIDAITTEDIQQVAKEIFDPARLTTMVYK